ncbi:MAG TPA: cyclic nucleotide-binding domain-containing protein [Urbifossiella sp.]|jgi:CRP-like cAMP-binding protein|nr:cyclic nucleotide-binding domain-containing protein [Urbifossiella sp.]
MTEVEFPAGHVFFRPGDPGDRAYRLLTGEVELLAGPPGRTVRVGLFGPGDVFGEMALVEERVRAATARATTAGRATAMSRDEFERLLTADPAGARRYLRSLFERLRSLSAQVAGEIVLADDPTGEWVQLGPAADPPELPTPAGLPAGWAAVLHPLTRKAAETMPDEGLRVTRFPFRIGRASGAHEPEAFDLNDLWLLDAAPFNVSRNHCELVAGRDGVTVHDRGSQLGCLVNEAPVGGRAGTGFAPLHLGDNVLVVGSQMSPYQFRITVAPT